MSISNTDLIQRLTLIRDKVDLLISGISIKEPLVEVSDMLGAIISEIRQQPAVSNAISIDLVDWLSTNHPSIYAIALAEDHKLNGALFHDPAHTISWTVATYAKAGNPVCVLLCALFSVALQPNHCAIALGS